MALIPYRGNLSAAVFPMTLADAGRTVINPQADQNFDRRVDPAGEQKDAGIPQAIYLENVIPTVNGYQSVGFITGDFLLTKLNNLIGTVRIFEPKNSLGFGNYYPIFVTFYTDNAVRWKEAAVDSIWKSAITTTGTFDFAGVGITEISTANVRGDCYLWNGLHLYQVIYNGVSLEFTNLDATVTGLTLADVAYITGSYNYLIAITTDGTVYWSSTTTPTDFTASLVTGAGSEIPTAYTGLLAFIHPNIFGFYIYTSTTVIAAAYTGNSRYPWKFTEVSNSGAYSSYFQVGWDNNSNIVYTFDNTGKLTLVQENIANAVAPEVSSFFERKRKTDKFNYSTNVFTLEDITQFTPLAATRRIWYFVDRYIFVSYKVGTSTNLFTDCLVYDTLLQRYGKIKLTHDYILCDETNIQFLNYITGNLHNLTFDLYNSDAVFAGVLFLGKFQFIRDRHLQLEEIDIESAQDSAYITRNFSLILFPSFDGKNFDTPVTLTPTYSGNLITAKTHKTALNHSLMLKGAFDVNTLQLKFRIAGER